MSKSRHGSPIEQVAGNGLLDRRALLGRGVMLAGAGEKFAHAYGVGSGNRVVIAANSDSDITVTSSGPRAPVPKIRVMP